jgi:hypothetical protein
MRTEKLIQKIIQMIRKKNYQIIDCNKSISHTKEGHLVLHPCDEEDLIHAITQSLGHHEEVKGHNGSV